MELLMVTVVFSLALGLDVMPLKAEGNTESTIVPQSEQNTANSLLAEISPGAHPLTTKKYEEPTTKHQRSSEEQMMSTVTTQEPLAVTFQITAESTDIPVQSTMKINDLPSTADRPEPTTNPQEEIDITTEPPQTSAPSLSIPFETSISAAETNVEGVKTTYTSPTNIPPISTPQTTTPPNTTPPAASTRPPTISLTTEELSMLTSLDTTSLDTTSLDTTSLDTTSLDTTSLDTTSLDTRSLDTTSLDTTSLDTTSLDTKSLNTTRDTKKAWLIIAIIALVVFCILTTLCVVAIVVKCRRRSGQQDLRSMNGQRSKKKKGTEDNVWAGPVKLGGGDCEGQEEIDAQGEEKKTDGVELAGLSTFSTLEENGGVGRPGSPEVGKWEEKEPLLFIDEEGKEKQKEVGKSEDADAKAATEKTDAKEEEPNGGEAFCLTTAV